MIIERLDLLAFGRFTNRSIDLSAGPRRFHIVHGPNESGKSTSLRALSDWLFGFQGPLVDDYVHRSSALRIGGRLTEPESGSVLECIRRKGNKDTLLAADNKTKISSELLDTLLQGIDKETFKQQFGISHQQLVEGGRLILEGKGDLSEILFSAGAGLGRLQNIRQDIAEQCKAIYTDRKSSSPRLYQWLDEWEALRTKLREQTLLPTTYNTIRADLARETTQAAQLANELAEARRAVEKLQSIQQAETLFSSRCWLLEKLEPLKNVVPLTNGFATKRAALQSEFAVADQQTKSLKERCDLLDKQLAEIQLDDVWLSQEATIDRLNRNVTQHEQSIIAVREKQAKRLQVRERIEELTRDIGAADKDDSFYSQALTAAARTELVSLANQYSGVMQRVSGAEEELQSAKANARKLKAELKNLAQPGSPAVLEEAIRSVGNPQSLLQALSRASAKVDAARENANLKLNQLIGFEGTLEQAVAIVLPSRSKLDDATSAIEEARQNLKTLDNSILQTSADREQLQDRIDEHLNESKLPDPLQFESLREERDRRLSELLDASSEGNVFPIKRAIELRDQVLEMDRIHALRHEYHDHVLRRERDDRQLLKLTDELTKYHAQRSTVCGALESATDHWKRLWADIGITASDVGEMRTWFNAHEQVVDAACDLSQCCIELQCAADAVEQAIGTLQASIRVSIPQAEPRPVKVSDTRDSLLFDDLSEEDDPASDEWLSDDPSLAALYANASKIAKELAARCQAYETLSNSCESAEMHLDAVQATANAANEKLKTWQERWATAIEPLKSLGVVTPESIDMMLKNMQEIASLRREIASLDNQQEQMLADQETFRAAVLAVTQQCAPLWLKSDEPKDEVSLVTQLLGAAKKQRDQKKKRDLLLEQRELAEASSRDAISQCKRIQAELLLLCKEANCDSSDDLAECERLSDERRDLMDKIAGIEMSLTVLAKGDSIESFEAEASQYMSLSIASEIESGIQKIEALEQEQAQSQQAVGRLNAEMKKMDGSDQAAELLQQQQSLLAKIRRDADQYAKLLIAQDVLAKAIENYRRQNEGTVLAKAGTYFARMTCQQYESLQVEFENNDKPKLYAVKAADKSTVPADRLSDGTADALYLAMRMASLDVHLHKNHPIPLIIDDCLIQFDDQRALAALEILSELSARTQVILFTHHEHLLDLAASQLANDHFHLHNL